MLITYKNIKNIYPWVLTLRTLFLAQGSLAPVSTRVIVFLGVFFFQKGHLGLTLIQLELFSLYVLYTVVFSRHGPRVTPVITFFLLCVLVSEAAIGIAFLVVSSRQRRGELEKFTF